MVCAAAGRVKANNAQPNPKIPNRNIDTVAL
jgi:hypothetical protein